ncbi:MAG: hypothetical protein PVI20_09725 [Desulfobacteraceae bacterium]|jgi:hypothetical protein
MDFEPGISKRILRAMTVKGMILVIAFGFAIVTLSFEVVAQDFSRGKRDNKKEDPRITEAELQSQVMGFADRFAVIMSQSFEDFKKNAPSPEAQLTAHDDLTYSMASVFTIAAAPNPQVAMLDMAALATMGRMVYEEHWLKEWGEAAAPFVRGYRQLETDIWRIVAQVLTPMQQEELGGMIQDWRRSHPEQLLFHYLRFSDLSAGRQQSTLVKAVKSGGLFGSVRQVTQQVEETRLLVERAMFLGTRLPLLGGDFANVWVSRLLTNPDVGRLLTNMDQVSGSIERVSKEMENLPGLISGERDKAINQAMDRVAVLRREIVEDVMQRVTVERKATIDQVMDGLTNQRKSLMQDLASEEEGVRPLLADLNQTLTTANNLVTSANSLTDKLGMGQPKEPAPEPSEPFDIKDYQETMVQASSMIEQVDGLLRTMEEVVSSPGWEKTLTVFMDSMERAEKTGEEFVDHTIWRVILLIVIFLFGLLLVLICQQYFSKRVFGSGPK